MLSWEEKLTRVYNFKMVQLDNKLLACFLHHKSSIFLSYSSQGEENPRQAEEQFFPNNQTFRIDRSGFSEVNIFIPKR